MEITIWASIVILLSIQGVLGDSQCPDPVRDVFYGEKCLTFYEDRSVSNYDDVLAFCQKRNQRLSAARSPNEQLLVINAIEKLGWSRVLVGLRFLKDHWRWISDGSPLRGQGCNEQISVHLPSGTYSNAMTVEMCIKTCQQRGNSRFAAVMSGVMCYCTLDYVWESQASSCNTPCAGSLAQKCGSTLNSLAFSTSPNVYDNWPLGKPGVGGSCASLLVDQSTNRWEETSCNLALPFLCRFDKQNVSIEKTVVEDTRKCVDGICYVLFRIPQLVWTDADTFCVSLGSRLAKIDSPDRQSQVNLLLRKASRSITQVWIGATNRYWTYQADGSFLKPDFQGWISVLEPVEPEVNQCASLDLDQGGGSYGWQTKPCSTMSDIGFRFVCETSLKNISTTTTTTTTSGTTTTSRMGPTTSVALTTSRTSTVPTSASTKSPSLTSTSSPSRSATSTRTPSTTRMTTVASQEVSTSISNSSTSTFISMVEVPAAIVGIQSTKPVVTLSKTESSTSTAPPSTSTSTSGTTTTRTTPLTTLSTSTSTTTTTSTSTTSSTTPSTTSSTTTTTSTTTTASTSPPTTDILVGPIANARIDPRPATTIQEICEAYCVNVTTNFQDGDSVTSLECWPKTSSITTSPSLASPSPSLIEIVDVGDPFMMLMDCQELASMRASMTTSSQSDQVPLDSFNTEYESRGLEWWVILLIAIGVLVVVGVPVGLGLYLCNKKKRRVFAESTTPIKGKSEVSIDIKRSLRSASVHSRPLSSALDPATVVT